MTGRDYRPRHPGLSEPVRLPAGHPEGYSCHPDATDALLADLHDQLWPDEEWIDVEDCPRPDLDPYGNRALALEALRSARRARRLRYVFYRVHFCPCGSWHVGPLFLRSHPGPSAEAAIRGATTALLALSIAMTISVGVAWLNAQAARRDPVVVRTHTPATPVVAVTPRDAP